MNQKFAIYARVSTKDQSTASQLQRCLKWSLDNLVSVEVFKDEDISGMQASRPEFDRMCEAIRKGRIKGVIVFALDRLTRSAQHLLNLLAEWQRLKVAFVAVNQGIDAREENPMGRLQITVLAAFAEFERNMIVERVNAGLANARRNGVVLGRKPTEQTEEQAAAVADHFALHGTVKFRDLAKACGVNHGLAGRWLKKFSMTAKPQQPTPKHEAI